MVRRNGPVERWWAVAGVLAMTVGASALGGVVGVRASTRQPANAWATIASTRPGVGCSVDVSVEVREGGEPVAGLAVEVVYFADGTDPTSEDEAVTGDEGVAWLAFDTSGASAGANGWLDINLGGVYAGGTSIIPRSGGDCGSGGTVLTVGADLPVLGSAGEFGVGQVIAGVPAYKQAHALSCEFAAIYIATSVFGAPIAEDESLALTTWSDNPHFGFRGDIDGPWGSTDDYGIYAEALVPILASHGYAGEVAYDASAEYLQAQLDAGRPTLVWIATRGDTGFYDWDAAGNRFKLVPYEHVVVAYGYDDAGVYVSDPGPGNYRHLSWGWFLDAWAVMDGMSLAVYPA